MSRTPGVVLRAGGVVAALVIALGLPRVALSQSFVNVDTVVASGLQNPVYVTHAGDGSGRLFIVEKAGRIRILSGGSLLSTPFLDITSIVSDAGEGGLLSVAFHPNYAVNGVLFVAYTDLAGDSVVTRYAVSAAPDVADPASAAVILTVAQFATNHNGGQLQFGPDGYLYVGMGDGGGGNDPGNHGQNEGTLLGAMLRIDIDSASPYASPPTNPYVGAAGADEIWAIGVRNPWRFSFDRTTGDMYIGDVGQGAWEEINFEAAGSAGGLNYGWVTREGPCPLGEVLPCAAAGAAFTDPVAAYGRSEGRSVTGGYVYRGYSSGMVGRYYYGDFVNGNLWSIRQTGTSPATFSAPVLELNTGFNISSFGEDEAGEIYVADYFGGTIRRLEAGVQPVPAAAVLTSPAGDSESSPASYQWPAVRGATRYHLWIYGPGGQTVFQQQFAAATLGCVAGGVCSVSLGGSLGLGGYTWFVRAENDTGVAPWSNEGAFRIVPPRPQPASPAGSLAFAPPNYSWPAVAGVAQYHLWLYGPDGSTRFQQWFTADQAGCAGGGTCAVEVPGLVGDGSYSWYLRTWGPSTGYGDWSDAGSFTVDALVAPVGATSASPTYSWNRSPNAEQYHFWLYGPGGVTMFQGWFTADQVGCASAGTCSLALGGALGAGSYTWYVRTWSAADGYGQWHGPLTFIIP